MQDKKIRLIHIPEGTTQGQFIIETECGHTLVEVHYNDQCTSGANLDRHTAQALASTAFTAIKKSKGMEEEHNV